MFGTNMPKLMLLNGPNLNLLGQREPEIYGSYTLKQLEQELMAKAAELDIPLECHQSNAEETLIELIHGNAGQAFILFNPAAFTHTSVALRDALLGTQSRFIEIHISNPSAREAFRKTSYFSYISESFIF